MKFAIVTVRIPDPSDVHHQALAPVVVMLENGLRALGHDTFVTGTGPEISEFFWPEDRVSIVVNVPMLGFKGLNVPPLPERTILYNFESVRSPLIENMLPLFRARRVWESFTENLELWKGRGVTPTAYVPFGWVKELETVAQRPEEEKDFDVFFYGSLNDRRLRVLRALDAFSLHNVFAPPSNPLYGRGLSEMLARSKVVLNMRFRDDYPTPTLRAHHALANRCLVVSEPGDFGVRGGIVTAACEELAAKAAAWASAPARMRSAVAELGQSEFREKKAQNILQRALRETFGVE